MNSLFISLLSDIKYDMKMLLNHFPDEHLINAIMEILARGVAVSLILPSETENHLLDHVFLFNRFMVAKNKGCELYFSSEVSSSYIIMDYQKAIANQENNKMELLPAELIPEHIRLFFATQNSSTLWMFQPEDLDVQLTLQEDVMLEGDEVVLTWKVANAHKVLIEGLGEVDAIGKQKLKPNKDTIFKIGAYNSNQTKVKTAALKVLTSVEISYDLSFAGRATEEYYNLTSESNYPHAYGVAKGAKVKLTWLVPNLKEVYIHPFGIRSATGSHNFLPKSNMDIEIRAKAMGRLVIRRIHLLVFPIAIFKDQFIQIKPIDVITPNYTENSKNKVSQPFNDQNTYNQQLNNIRKKQLQKYAQLTHEIRKFVFDNSIDNFNLNEANRKVFAKLKKLYSKENGVQQALDAIRSIYDYTQKRK